MRILYISQYFPPEIGAPAVRVHDLARLWVQQGHEVTVLTGFPNHPTGVLNPAYRKKFRRLTVRESVDGIDVVRTWLLPLPNRKAFERILNYSSFMFSAALRGFFLKKYDVVISTSPQLLVGLSGLFISRLRGGKFIFEVRDLWPESLIATGTSGEDSFMYRALRRISSYLYRKADHVVVVTPAFKKYIAGHFDCVPEKISVVANGVDLEWFEEAQAGYVPARNGKFVVSFIGTIGNAHGVEVILEAAQMLRESDPSVVFQIVGDGAERAKIQESVHRAGARNVRILPQQPRSKVPALIWDSDVCLVLLKQSEVFKTVIPTKMLEFMACGRPVILGVEGQAMEILEAAHGGVGIPPGNAEALAAAVIMLQAQPQLRELYGKNASAYIGENFSRKTTAMAYERLLFRLLGDGSSLAVRKLEKSAGAP